ncbi:MAG: S16 family serine protease [Candidatus Nanopelagicales bacterium]
MSSRRRVALATATAVATAAALAACSGGSTSTTVPALWYRPALDGAVIGGTTPVTVTASRDGTGPFRVDLAGIQSSRDRFRVAAWNAATVAMLTAGLDPRGRTVTFAAADPLDGPSSGALLAVAAWAALDGRPVPDGVSLTGTVLPNGSVGPVTGIPAKLRGAAEAGIHTVLIPTQPTQVIDDQDGEPTDPVSLGRTLGLDVRRVASITEASAIMHGDEPTPVVAAPPLDPDLVDLVTIASHQIIDQVVATRPTDPALREAITASRRALAEGQPFTAYSTITLAQQDQAMSAAAATTERGRPRQVRRSLIRAIATARQHTHRTLRHDAATPLRATEQYPALADALTWATGTLALLEPLPTAARNADNRSEMAAIARQLARAEYRVDTYLPLQIEAVERIGRDSVADPGGVLEVLTAYTQLLGEAGDANSEALRSEAKSVAPELDDRVEAQRVVWQASEGGADQQHVLARLASALSYYIASANAVVAGGLADADGGFVDEAFFADQVRLAARQNDALSTAVTALDLDPSYVLWGDDWGRTWARTTRSSDTRLRTTGLTYQWYATVQGQMLRALAEVSGRG